MPTTRTMTIRLNDDTKAKLERISKETRRSKAFLAAEAVAAYVDRESAIIEGVTRGVADAEAGRTVPHEQAIAGMRQLIQDAKRKKAVSG